MASRLEQWARTERQALHEEIGWLKAGGKVLSPGGDDITAMKLEQLDARLEGVNLALKEIEDTRALKARSATPTPPATPL